MMMLKNKEFEIIIQYFSSVYIILLSQSTVTYQKYNIQDWKNLNFLSPPGERNEIGSARKNQRPFLIFFFFLFNKVDSKKLQFQVSQNSKLYETRYKSQTLRYTHFVTSCKPLILCCSTHNVRNRLGPLLNFIELQYVQEEKRREEINKIPPNPPPPPFQSTLTDDWIERSIPFHGCGELCHRWKLFETIFQSNRERTRR